MTSRSNRPRQAASAGAPAHVTVSRRSASDVASRAAARAIFGHVRAVSAREPARTPPAAAAAAPDAGRPIGMALISWPGLHGGRVYLCDPAAHRIDVADERHRPIFSFGSYGSQPGQFDTPSDVAIVWAGTDDVSECPAETAMLAVADRGNHRIQLFELDGSSVGVIDGSGPRSSVTGWPARAGWPFFRLGALPALWFPSRLEWRAPHLDVGCSSATMVRIDLAAALLPDFRTWIREASPRVLRQAFHLFTADPNRAEIPDACLLEIAERLQPATREAFALSWRGRT